MFKVITDGCQPTRGTKYSAAIDLYAAHDAIIGAGETVIVGCGIKIDLNELQQSMSDAGLFGNYQIGSEPEFNDHVLEIMSEFLEHNYLQLMIRSSLAVKGLMLGNGVGVIDLDYPDEIKMIIHNPLTIRSENLDNTGCDVEYANFFEIKKGDKIGQITLLQHSSKLFNIDTEAARTGGFGHTGE